MTNQINLYDKVILKNDFYEDAIPKNNTLYKKGSVGIVIEVLENNTILIELPKENYKNNIIEIDISLVSKE